LEDGALRVKLAATLAPGDRLPLFDGGAAPSMAPTDPRIDLIASLPRAQRARTRVRISGGSGRDHAGLLRRELGPVARDYVRGDYLPLERYLEFEAAGRLTVPHDRLVLWTGRGAGRASMPAVVSVTPDVARLVGYYLSGGRLTDDGSLRVRFAFRPDEAGCLEDLA